MMRGQRRIQLLAARGGATESLAAKTSFGQQLWIRFAVRVVSFFFAA